MQGSCKHLSSKIPIETFQSQSNSEFCTSGLSCGSVLAVCFIVNFIVRSAHSCLDMSHADLTGVSPEISISQLCLVLHSE